MEDVDLTRFVLSFVFVVGLIGVLAMLMRRYGHVTKGMFGAKEGSGRLEVIEVRHIDPRRKLALVRRDGVEHLLLLSDGKETVVEAGIKKDA